MAKATPNLNFSVLLPTEGSLKTFVTMIRSIYQNLVSVINGSLGFGDGTSSDNISGAWINVVAPAAPNTDFTVIHNLNRLPVGYWIMQKDRACDVYTGSVAATKTQLTLRATVASAVLRLFIVGVLLSLFCLGASAQTTSVTLQVTDAGAQSWNSGTWSALLVSQLGGPSGPPFNLANGTPVPNQSQSGALSVTGGASLIVTPNASIFPVNSQWQFKVCPAQGIPTQCFLQSFTIVGASQTVNVVPPAISVSCGPGVNAYADSEVNCGIGGQYYNVTLVSGRVCQASTGNTCTTWAAASGGTPGGSNTQVQYNNSGAFAGSSALTWSTVGNTLTIIGGVGGSGGGLTVQNSGNNRNPLVVNANAGTGFNTISLGQASVAGDHVNQGVSNKDFASTLTFAASTTASVTYANAFASTPIVIITPVNPGAVTFTLTATSNTGFTVTGSASNSLTVNYIVIGNPN